MLSKERKAELTKKFGKNKGDTGNSKVQIAILTASILEMNQHLLKNKKDIVTRRSLLKKVAQRKTLLRYLKKHEPSEYESITTALKIRKK